MKHQTSPPLLFGEGSGVRTGFRGGGLGAGEEEIRISLDF